MPGRANIIGGEAAVEITINAAYTPPTRPSPPLPNNSTQTAPATTAFAPEVKPIPANRNQSAARVQSTTARFATTGAAGGNGSDFAMVRNTGTNTAASTSATINHTVRQSYTPSAATTRI